MGESVLINRLRPWRAVLFTAWVFDFGGFGACSHPCHEGDGFVLADGVVEFGVDACGGVFFFDDFAFGDVEDEDAVGLDDVFREGAGVGVAGGLEEAGGFFFGVWLVGGGDFFEGVGFFDAGVFGGVGEGFAGGEGFLDFGGGFFGGGFHGLGGFFGDVLGACFVACFFVGFGA